MRQIGTNHYHFSPVHTQNREIEQGFVVPVSPISALDYQSSTIPMSQLLIQV